LKKNRDIVIANSKQTLQLTSYTIQHRAI